MYCIKRLTLWLIALVTLSACSTAPFQSPASESAADAAEAEESELLPDPYLAQKRPLSARARAAYAAASKAIQAQEWQQAKSLLEQMTQNHPTLSDPHVSLGLVYRKLNDYAKAEEAFHQAIVVNELNSEAYNQLAVLSREQGEFEQAEDYYLQALEVWPHNPVVHRNLGILYDLYMGRFADALTHYQMSQKLTEEPERQLKGWIVDLQRRITEQQAAVK